ncbi:MAG: hypothetical protein JST40_05415 [Armatimonadetes bacterium]|nr:hypothetical protein [Armatimonadota bacterium]
MTRTMRNWVIAFIGVGAIAGIALAVSPYVTDFLRQNEEPIDLIEHLSQPTQVLGWSEQGLELSDGRVVMPSGMTALPKQSKTLSCLIRSGVELGPTGKTFGLVRIWHWCGNDPVRTDIRRIDLAQMLAFYREGKTTLKLKTKSSQPFVEGKFGWSISDFYEFRSAFDPAIHQ